MNVYRVFRLLGPFPTHDYDLWIRTSGEKVPFLAFGIGPPAENVGKSQGKRKNNASGKMAVFGPFFGPWMAKSCQKRSPRFDIFPTVSRDFFCIFSLLCDHDLRLFYCPYLFTFLIFYYKKSTTQHTTYTILNHTHAHTQTHLPLILRVV